MSRVVQIIVTPGSGEGRALQTARRLEVVLTHCGDEVRVRTYLSVLVFFGLVAYLVCTSGSRRCRRWTSIALALATVLTIGFSRLYLNVHWLSDVGGGFAVGLAYLLLLSIWLVERLPARSYWPLIRMSS